MNKMLEKQTTVCFWQLIRELNQEYVFSETIMNKYYLVLFYRSPL